MPDDSRSDDLSPAGTYRARIAELRSREQALQRQHIWLSYARLAIGIVFIALLLPPRWWAWLPLFAFAAAARAHDNVLQKLAATRRVLASCEHALARVEDRWAGVRPRSTRLDLSQSLYAVDLDLFGPGSLFELLCEARTSLGEDTLAGWLLKPATTPELLDRQAAVADLRKRRELHEALAAARGPALALLDQPALTRWSEGEVSQPPAWLRWLAPLLVLVTAAMVWVSFRIHAMGPAVVMLAINGGLTFGYRKSITTLFGDAQPAAEALATAAALMGAIEREHFDAPRLHNLRQQVSRAGGRSAARALARLAVFSDWIDARSNYLVRLLDAPLLYSVQLALVVNRWKVEHSEHLGAWLAVLGEFEALLSLAVFSFEHPADPFPAFIAGPARLEAVGLGHPLLPTTTCVRNDVQLGAPTRALLISGSNMSGKSTLLRSVGINAVLAFAGAPVRARALSLSVMTVAASLQVNDSLQENRSRFMAEILRLRAIAEATRNERPVLFLVDELLAGTNSRDRLAGAQGVLNELLKGGAIGILTTHDLALTSVVSLAPYAVRNMHFEDVIEDGEIRFDYQLREGQVERSNGIALMRLIGLDV